MTKTAARAAAARTRDLADIISSRTALHPARDVRLRMIDYLTAAAAAFEESDGAVTPFGAAAALLQCQALADNHPAAGVAEDVFYYVAAPVSRCNPEVPDLAPVSSVLAGQESRLRSQISLAAHDLDREGDATNRYAILATLADLHYRFDRLAETVQADNLRPTPTR
ncbi:hypothetical protein ACGFR8_07850 [Streptomyces brevispora]|uniref:hypothetical protein n=1 Tax=Streptomyces brevispora TaxID=887462 RepID=UPI00371D9EDB